MSLKRQVRSLVWVVFLPPFNLGVCAREMGSQLISFLGGPPRWRAAAEGGEHHQRERAKPLPGGSTALPFARLPAPAVSQQTRASACPRCGAGKHHDVRQRGTELGCPSSAASPRPAETAAPRLHGTAGCKVTVKRSYRVSRLGDP